MSITRVGNIIFYQKTNQNIIGRRIRTNKIVFISPASRKYNAGELREYVSQFIVFLGR